MEDVGARSACAVLYKTGHMIFLNHFSGTGMIHPRTLRPRTLRPRTFRPRIRYIPTSLRPRTFHP